MTIDLKEKVRLVLEAADDKKAEEAVALDLRELSSVTDFFVVASGGSDTQVRAIADSILKKLAEKGIEPYGTEGYNDGTWVLLDFVDVVAHIFHRDKRIYYALENLWSDAPRFSEADLAQRKKLRGKKTTESLHGEK